MSHLDLPRPSDDLLHSIEESPQSIYRSYVYPVEQEVKGGRNIQRVSKDILLMHIRILGRLLIHGPTIVARAYVAQEIATIMGRDQGDLSVDFSDTQLRELDELGKRYLDHFIRPCTHAIPFVFTSV